MSDSVPRYQRSGDAEYFLVGMVGQADASESWENLAQVNLVSDESDPVGAISLVARFREGDDFHGAEVFLDGGDAAILGAILQDAARQWQDRHISYEWSVGDRPPEN